MQQLEDQAMKMTQDLVTEQDELVENEGERTHNPDYPTNGV